MQGLVRMADFIQDLVSWRGLRHRGAKGKSIKLPQIFSKHSLGHCKGGCFPPGHPPAWPLMLLSC